VTDPGIPSPGYFRDLIRLTPKQFGYLGRYSTEMLQVERLQNRIFGDMALRFTTSILSGKTVTEKQRASVKVPASWWQHLKQAAGAWHTAWLRKPDSPWLLFLLPLDILTIVPRAWLVPWFLRRHPVRYAELTAEVRFTRDTLYPGADISLPPDRFGPPVVYETLEISPIAPDSMPWRLEEYGPARFLNRHEIVSGVLQDPGVNGTAEFSSVRPAGPEAVFGVLEWLSRHGVSVDQFVAREHL
jgi:hypothetical protein